MLPIRTAVPIPLLEQLGICIYRMLQAVIATTRVWPIGLGKYFYLTLADSKTNKERIF